MKITNYLNINAYYTDEHGNAAGKDYLESIPFDAEPTSLLAWLCTNRVVLDMFEESPFTLVDLSRDICKRARQKLTEGDFDYTLGTPFGTVYACHSADFQAHQVVITLLIDGAVAEKIPVGIEIEEGKAVVVLSSYPQVLRDYLIHNVPDTIGVDYTEIAIDLAERALAHFEENSDATTHTIGTPFGTLTARIEERNHAK